MRTPLYHILPLALVAALGLTACSNQGEGLRLESIPMGETPAIDSAYARGVSGHFAFIYTLGADSTYLVMGGGCNFPDLPPSRGGQKRYYSAIYRAPLTEQGVGAWEHVGELKQPLAYAGSVTVSDEQVHHLLLYGGETPHGDTSEEVWMVADRNGVHIPDMQDVCGEADPSADTTDRSSMADRDSLPKLSGTAAVYQPESAGVYLIGGRQGGILTNTVRFGSSFGGYQLVKAYPGAPRLKVVAWASPTTVYMIGSISSTEGRDTARLALGAYRLDAERNRWIELALPTELQGATFGGGAAIPWGAHAHMLLGGVHAEAFLPAVQRGQQIRWAKEDGDTRRADSLTRQQNAYLEQPVAWYRFNPRAWLFDHDSERWHLWGEHPDLARADAVYLPYRDGILVIGGELKPGVRTTKIQLIRPKK